MTNSLKKKKARKASKKDAAFGKGKSTVQTSTAFKSKSIVLPNQSLDPKKESVQILSNISLLRHHSPSNRKSALHHLLTAFQKSQKPNSTAHPFPPSQFFPSIAPLIVDADHSIRKQLYTILEDFPHLLPSQAKTLLLYIYSAASHIQSDVRKDSTKFLKLLLETCPSTVISGPGWEKSLRVILNVMGWQQSEQATRAIPDYTVSDPTVNLPALYLLLEEALETSHASAKDEVPDHQKHLLDPPDPGVFDYLNLFGDLDVKGSIPNDQPARVRWLVKGNPEVLKTLRKGCKSAKRASGDQSRWAGKIEGLLDKYCEVKEEEEERIVRFKRVHTTPREMVMTMCW